MGSPRAAFGVTPQGAALADRQSRIGGALGFGAHVNHAVEILGEVLV